MNVEILPFVTPEEVRLKQPIRPRQDGFRPAEGLRLSEIPAEDLALLCDQFRAEVFAKAGKADPRWPLHEAVYWNPGNKVVQDHRDGTVDLEATNRERAKRGLPVPWRPDLADAETRMPDIL